MTETNVTMIEVYTDDAGEWRWRAKAGNGEIVCTGESHAEKSNCVRAARGVFPDVVIDLGDDSKR